MIERPRSKKEKARLRKNLNNYKIKDLKDLIVYLSPLEKASHRFILERDNYQCRFCGRKEEIQVHHITPKSLGGTNHENNLITLCHWCHIFIHSNPMNKINKSELVKSQINKVNGDTFSKRGLRWGKKPYPKEARDKVIELYKKGLSMREIAKNAYFWDANKNKQYVSLTFTCNTINKYKKEQKENE